MPTSILTVRYPISVQLGLAQQICASRLDAPIAAIAFSNSFCLRKRSWVPPVADVRTENGSAPFSPSGFGVDGNELAEINAGLDPAFFFWQAFNSEVSYANALPISGSTRAQITTFSLSAASLRTLDSTRCRSMGWPTNSNTRFAKPVAVSREPWRECRHRPSVTGRRLPKYF